MTTPETELIQATKDFATQCGQEWNEIIESMVLNAYREGQNELNVKWGELRKNFFKECTSKKIDVRAVSVAPHNLFEWFKREILEYINPNT